MTEDRMLHVLMSEGGRRQACGGWTLDSVVGNEEILAAYVAGAGVCPTCWAHAFVAVHRNPVTGEVPWPNVGATPLTP